MRIDLTQWKNENKEWYACCEAGEHYTDVLLAELKRCYERIDRLLETIGSWGYVMCPRSNEWFEWDYGCQSEICANHDDDCRELVEASE